MLFAIATTADVGIFYIIVLAATATAAVAIVPTTFAFTISNWTIYIRARLAVVAIRNTFVIIIIRTLFVTIIVIIIIIIVRKWII